ncbi:hypothetical protein Nepgr_030142 [Nepenthes gracilis]|uniref:Uncharacterized protein n=1 Tax=Nepenthes gracilis TaxID=150966 RepID=A0AAD3TFN4_NEPGR|nr:hypothetical protein Nepgr_030142 [Nepenthes gracilis]
MAGVPGAPASLPFTQYPPSSTPASLPLLKGPLPLKVPVFPLDSKSLLPLPLPCPSANLVTSPSFLTPSVDVDSFSKMFLKDTLDVNGMPGHEKVADLPQEGGSRPTSSKSAIEPTAYHSTWTAIVRKRGVYPNSELKFYPPPSVDGEIDVALPTKIRLTPRMTSTNKEESYVEVEVEYQWKSSKSSSGRKSGHNAAQCKNMMEFRPTGRIVDSPHSKLVQPSSKRNKPKGFQQSPQGAASVVLI